jgi:hypothetical protein
VAAGRLVSGRDAMIPLATALLLMCAPVDGDSGTCDQIGRYRIAGIDTPEILGRCDYERDLAQRAKAYAVEFMSSPVLVEHDGRRDRYRRLLVRISQDVGPHARLRAPRLGGFGRGADRGRAGAEMGRTEDAVVPVSDKTITRELTEAQDWLLQGMADDAAIVRYSGSDGAEKESFDHQLALARLLVDERVVLNRKWWEPGKEREWAVAAICNDVFAWASADAEPIDFDELRAVYEHHMADPLYGVEKWCIKKRGMMPQTSYVTALKQAGKWDLDESGLAPNAYDAALRARAGV